MAHITNTETDPANSRVSYSLLYHNRVTVAQWSTYTSAGLGGTARKMLIRNPAGSGSVLYYWIGDVTPTASNYLTLEQGESVIIDVRNSYFRGSGATASITVEVVGLQ